MKRNTILVGTLTLVSLLLGFGRESYIAYLFGATQFTDAFYVSMLVPDLVAGWIGYTLINALIPVLKKESDVSRLSGERLISVAFNYAAIGSAVLAVGVFIFADHIIGWLAPSFNTVQMHTGTHFLQIMSAAILFSALSGLLSGINNTFEQYMFSSLVGIFYNSFFFIALFMLYRWIGVDALAYGLLAGVISRCLIQLIPLIKSKKLKLRPRAWHPSLPAIGQAMIPIFLSQALTQINQIIDRILASGLSPGQISNLNYASKLGQLPTGLIGGTIATTMYIRLVKSYNNNDLNEMGRLYAKGLTWILFAGFLVCGGLVLFGDSLVSIFYYHGQFTLHDVKVTTSLLKLYGAFSFFYMMLPISTQFFFAHQGGKWIIISSVAAVIVNVTLGYILVHRYGVMGLVIANGMSIAVNFLILFRLAIRRVRKHPVGYLWLMVKTAAPAGAIIILVLYLYTLLVPSSSEDSKLWLLTRGGGALLAVSVVMWLAARVWGNNEILSNLLQISNKLMNSSMIRKLTKKVTLNGTK